MTEADRKARTRRLIAKGGVVEMSGIEAVIGDDLPLLLGVLAEARQRAAADPALVQKWKNFGKEQPSDESEPDTATRH